MADLKELRDSLALVHGLPDAVVQHTLAVVARLKALTENIDLAGACSGLTPSEIAERADAARAKIFATARAQGVDLQSASFEHFPASKWVAIGLWPDDALIFFVHALGMGSPAASKVLN